MKRRFSLFTYPVMDMKAAEAELNRRAAAGWKLEKLWFGTVASFAPAEEPVCYCLDWCDPGRMDGRAYRTLLADAGWRFHSQTKYWNVYEAPAGTTPIQTDGELEYRRFREKALHRIKHGGGSLAALAAVLAALLLMEQQMGLGAGVLEGLDLITRYQTGAMFALFSPLILLGGVLWGGRLLLRLTQWQQAAEEGRDLPVPGRWSALAAALFCLAGQLFSAVLLVALLLDGVSGAFGKRYLQLTIIVALAAMVWKQGLEYQRQRESYRAKVVAAAVLLMLGALPYGLTACFRVEPPLAGVDLEFIGEVREETSATFLGARTSWVEVPQKVEHEGETYYTYSAEGTKGDAWTLPWPWLADWAEGLCRRTAGTELQPLEGYEGVWARWSGPDAHRLVIRRGNTVVRLNSWPGSRPDEDWLNTILSCLEGGTPS